MKKLFLLCLLSTLLTSVQAQKQFKIIPYSDSTWVYVQIEKRGGTAVGVDTSEEMSKQEAIRFAFRQSYRAKRQYAKRFVQLEVLETEQRRWQNTLNAANQLDTNYFDLSARRFPLYQGEWRLVVGTGEDRLLEKVTVNINSRGKFRIVTKEGETSVINEQGRLNTGLNIHTDTWVEITNLFDEKVQLYARSLYGIDERESNANSSGLPYFIGTLSDDRRVVLRQTKVFVETEDQN